MAKYKSPFKKSAKLKTRTDLTDPLGMDVNQTEAEDGQLPPADPIPDESDAVPDGAKAEAEESTDAEPAGETAESEAKEFIDKFVGGLEESYELEYAKQAIQRKLDEKSGGAGPSTAGNEMTAY